MKINLRLEEYDFLNSMLMYVDTKSYDPVYKNLVERIEKTASKEGIDKIVFLEETEVNRVIDALDEYIDDAENGNFSEKEKSTRIAYAKEFSTLIKEETGFML